MSTVHRPAAHLYRAAIEWTGAASGGTTSYDAYSREYRVAIDGKPPLRGSADVPFRGDAAHYNPEDLLVCALAACHMLSYLAICARAGIVVVGYADDAVGTMTFVERKLRFTEVVLRPRVVVASGDLDRAAALHGHAHDECFVANSVNFPVRHEATVRGH